MKLTPRSVTSTLGLPGAGASWRSRVLHVARGNEKLAPSSHSRLCPAWAAATRRSVWRLRKARNLQARSTACATAAYHWSRFHAYVGQESGKAEMGRESPRRSAKPVPAQAHVRNWRWCGWPCRNWFCKPDRHRPWCRQSSCRRARHVMKAWARLSSGGKGPRSDGEFAGIADVDPVAAGPSVFSTALGCSGSMHASCPLPTP